MCACVCACVCVCVHVCVCAVLELKRMQRVFVSDMTVSLFDALGVRREPARSVQQSDVVVHSMDGSTAVLHASPKFQSVCVCVFTR